jgi:hypothetical protein
VKDLEQRPCGPIADAPGNLRPVSMIERVAKAIAWLELTPHGKQACRWPADFSPAERATYRRQARAAIDEMWEASKGMIEAGAEGYADAWLADNPDAVHHVTKFRHIGAAYREMINAALAEVEEVAEGRPAGPSVPESIPED